MIILGFREVTTNGDRGLFDCPRCERLVDYRVRKVRNFFTLYWIPIIPLNLKREFVRCDECKYEFQMQVLDSDYVDPQQIARDAFCHAAINLVLLPMAMIDGQMRDSERTTMSGLAWELFGGALDETILDQQIQNVQRSRSDELLHELKIASNSFDEDQKEILLMSAWRVASIDGDLTDDQWRVLAELGEAMELTAYQMDALISQAEKMYQDE